MKNIEMRRFKVKCSIEFVIETDIPKKNISINQIKNMIKKSAIIYRYLSAKNIEPGNFVIQYADDFDINIKRIGSCNIKINL